MKLISVNVEGHRHFEERLLPFLKQEQPDFLCLQEVFEVDFLTLKKELGMAGFFYPMCNITEVTIHQTHAWGIMGVAQLTKLPITHGAFNYYVHDGTTIFDFDSKSDPNHMSRVLAWMNVIGPDQKTYTIGTTHFVWTPNGGPTEFQTQTLAKLWPILDTLPPYVIAGDFNAARGQATFDEIASRLKDNIPPEYTTSIDGQFHKAGNLQLMVDGMFSTPSYRVENVRLVDGVSDHKPVVGEVTRID